MAVASETWPVTVETSLGPHGTVAADRNIAVTRDAMETEQWTQELQACLDAPWAAQVDVTDIQGEVAHLLVHSAAAATKLRFMLPELQSKLSHLQSFSRVRDFRIRVSS